jgi:hypothetical protein
MWLRAGAEQLQPLSFSTANVGGLWCRGDLCMYCTVGWAGPAYMLYCSLCASRFSAASTCDCSSSAKACNPVVVASIRTLFLLLPTRLSFPARWISRTSETAPVCVLRLYCFVSSVRQLEKHAHGTTKSDVWAFEGAFRCPTRLRCFLAGGSFSLSSSVSESESPKPTNVRASLKFAFMSSAFAAPA